MDISSVIVRIGNQCPTCHEKSDSRAYACQHNEITSTNQTSIPRRHNQTEARLSMIIIMKLTSSKKELSHVVNEIEKAGFKPHVSQGAETTIIGVIGDERKFPKEH